MRGAMAAAALLMTGAPAGAAENLGCMDAGYSAEDTATSDRFVKTFVMADWMEKGAPPDIIALISGRAGTCAEANQWSPEAIEQAIYYRMGVLLTTALEAQTPLTTAQMNRLHQMFSGPDKAKIVAIMTPAIDAAFSGEPAPEAKEADQMFIGRMILRTGIAATDANASFVGSWMGGRTITEMARERFKPL